MRKIKLSLQPQQKRIRFCIACGVILIILPLFLPTYLQSMMTKVLIFAIFAMSLDILMGYAGLVSLGHAAYFGVAGYTTSIMIVKYNIESFWLSAPLSILMAVVFAAIFGLIALRASGIYFLLITFALGQLLYSVAWKWVAMTGGSDGTVGVPFPVLGISWFSWNDIYFYYFVLLTFVICSFLLYRFVNSPFGHALQGIRENEPRMRALGYNTWLYKYIAFIIAGLFAGVAGMLFAYYSRSMFPTHLGFLTAALVLLMVIIGGTGTLLGPVIGAGVIIFLNYFVSIIAPARWPLILGIVYIVAVMYWRGGISIYLVRLWNKVERSIGSLKG